MKAGDHCEVFECDEPKGVHLVAGVGPSDEQPGWAWASFCGESYELSGEWAKTGKPIDCPTCLQLLALERAWPAGINTGCP